MEDDIVKRLRKQDATHRITLFRLAADEIERLRQERDEAMALVKTIAHDVSVLSTRPAAIVKLPDLVDRINEWGDAARQIISQLEDGRR
jgi:hypothetical protein